MGKKICLLVGLVAFVARCSLAQTNLPPTTLPAPQWIPSTKATERSEAISVALTPETVSELTGGPWYESNWFAATAGGLGVILGTLGAFGAVCFDHRKQARRQAQDEQQFNRNLLQLFRNDIVNEAVIYDGAIGGSLIASKSGTPFATQLSLTEGNFLLFSQMAPFVPKLDPHAAKLILDAYTKKRFLIEQYRINNQVIGRFNSFRNRGDDESNRLREEAKQQLISSSDQLRMVDAACRQATEDLLQYLAGIGISEPSLPARRQARP